MNGQFLGDRRINVSKFRYKGGDVRYRRTVTIDQPSGAYRLVVIGIPNDTVALELQSWVRSKGVEGLVHCSVYQRHSQREGLLEFNRRIDYDNAIRNLDGNVIFGSKVSVRDEHEWVRQKREQGPLGGAPRRGVPRDRPRMDGGFRDNPRSSYNNGYGNNNNNNYRDDPHRRRRDYPPRDDGHYPRRRSPPPDNRRFDDRPSTMSGGGAPRFDDRDGGIRAPPAPLPPPPTMPGSEPPRYHNNHDHNRAVDPSGHPPPLPPPPSHHGHRGPDDGAVIADQGSRDGRIDRYRDDTHHSSHHPPPYRDRELVVELTHSGTGASTTSTTTVGSGTSVGAGAPFPPPPRDGYDDYNRGRQRERDPVTIEKREPPVIRDFQDEAPPIREDEKEYFTAHNEDDRLQRRRERFMDNGSNNNYNDRRRDFSRSRSRDRRRPLPPDHRDGPGMVDDRAQRYHRDRFYDEVSSGGSSATAVSSAAVAPPNDQLPPVSSSSLDKTNNVGLSATQDRPTTPVRSTNPDNGNVDYPPE